MKTKELKKAVLRDVAFVTIWWLFAIALDNTQWASDVVDYIGDVIYEVLYPLNLGRDFSDWTSIFVAFAMLTAFLSFSYRYIAGFVKKLFNK